MERLKKQFFCTALIALFAICWAGMSFANGVPQPWQMSFQPAATPVMERIESLHTFLLYIIFAIAGFVALVLLYICWRFSEKRNKIPAKFTHHATLEVIWTIIPVLILILIGIPSVRLLYFMDKVDNPEVTLKAVGHQWYWEYVLPENDLAFDSYMIPDKDLKPGQKRLLDVDQPMVLPINTNIRILTTSTDVIHSFGVPAFGIKQDSVPGRLAEVWVNIKKPGTYYGQCYELCGMNHGFMPIQIHAVSRHEYDQWILKKGGKLSTSEETQKTQPAG